MSPFIEKEYFLSASDANAEGLISMAALTRNIIDIATDHANSLGIGNPTMKEMNMKAGWILSRLTIDMEKSPKVNERYILKTWIEDFNRHYSTRSFKISSPGGEVYGFCRTIWVVIDTESHKNLGLSHFTMPQELILGDVVPIARQERHFPIYEKGSGDRAPKSIESNFPPIYHTFKYCDLDFYRHVNTVRYVELLMNQFTLEEHDKHRVNRIELSFLHEASYGMETKLLRSDSEEDPCWSNFQLSEKEKDNAILFARVRREG